MLAEFQHLICSQYEAAFCLFKACIDRCPDKNWHATVARFPFSQVEMHMLVFADLYLSPNEQEMRSQDYHIVNAYFFGDYEQLQDKEPTEVYDRIAVQHYLDFCIDKSRAVVADETVESLTEPCGFPRKDFSRAELHVCNIRHIQHHTAQLTLRLRLDSDVDVPWISSGWQEL